MCYFPLWLPSRKGRCGVMHICTWRILPVLVVYICTTCIVYMCCTQPADFQWHYLCTWSDNNMTMCPNLSDIIIITCIVLVAICYISDNTACHKENKNMYGLSGVWLSMEKWSCICLMKKPSPPCQKLFEVTFSMQGISSLNSVTHAVILTRKLDSENMQSPCTF